MPLKETNWDNDLFGPYIDTIYKKMEIPFKPKMNVTVLTKGYHLRMKTYINHISSYTPYIPELKEYLFKFKHPIMAAAKEKLSRYGYDQMNGSSNVFISIHVRLTDYKTVLKDLQTISKSYFSRAMQYFNAKYRVSFSFRFFRFNILDTTKI